MDSIFTKTPLIWLLQSYWRDEAYSVILAQKPIHELFVITANDFSPPLYYLALKVWIMIFGSSEAATRSLSTLAFLALATAIFIYFRKVEKMSLLRTSIIELIIFASPILTYYAFETRMYSLAAFFVTCSWMALFTRKKWIFVLVSILGLYTHYFQALILVSQLIFVIWTEFVNGKNANFKTLFRSIYNSWGVQFTSIFLLFAPWVFFVVSNRASFASSFWIKKPTLDLVLNTPAILVTGYERDFNIKYGLIGISALIYILIITSCIRNLRNIYRPLDYLKSKHVAYMLWFFMPAVFVSVLSLFGPSLYLPRYLIVSSPALIFFVAYELKNNRLFVSLLLIAIILLQITNYQNLQIKNRTKENLRQVFANINNRTGINDVLYLESELDFHLAKHYFKYPENVYIVGKPYSELPSYVGKSLIPEEKVLIERPKNETGHWLKSDRTTPAINPRH